LTVSAITSACILRMQALMRVEALSWRSWRVARLTSVCMVL